MKRNVRSLVTGLILVVITLVACQPGQLNLDNYMKQGDRVLLAINDTIPVLTNRELFEHLWASEEWANGGTIDTIALARIVDSILADTVAGLVADADIVLTDFFPQYWGYNERYDETLLNAFYAKYIYSQVEIDSAQVLEFRDRNLERYSIPGQVMFYHILVSPKYYSLGPNALDYKYKSPEELASIQEDFAIELYEAIAGGEPFEAIAAEFSHDKNTRREGGLVGWAVRDRYHDPFDSIGFSAELNVVQAPYQDADGWHIIKVTDKVADGPLPLDRPEFFTGLYRDLRGELSSEIAGKIMDSLRQNLTIEYNDEVLDRDVFRSDEDIVAAVVNSIDTIYFMSIRNLELDYRKAYGIRNTTPEIKKVIIDRLAGRYLVIQTAQAEQMDTLPRIMQLNYALRHETTKTLVLGSRYDPSYRPSDSVIKAYYEANKQDYIIEQPLKIQTVIFTDSILADFISDQANSGVDLADLKRDYLEQGPKQDIGIKLIGPNDVSQSLWILLHQMPIGSTTRPFMQDSLWTVAKLIERKTSLTMDYARGGIVTILTKKHARDGIAQFTKENGAKFGIGRKAALTPIHLKPLRYRYNMVL